MTEPAERTVTVWDPAVRIFHWSLVAAFAAAWLTGDEWDAAHEAAGYVILGLVAVRVIWGLVGTRYARFWQFVKRPRDVLDYLREMLAAREHRYIGHNPAGGAMVVALLLALIGTGGTGWMMTLDMFWGAGWVEGLHEVLADATIVLVAVHIAGVVLASLRHRENLVRAMFNGRKREAAAGDVQ